MTDITPHATALAALGHEVRLSIFRLLIKAGHDGLRVGQVGDHLQLAASTLAHHLTTLVDSELIVQEKKGREVVNRVDFEAIAALLDFLTSECCQGIDTVTPADAKHKDIIQPNAMPIAKKEC